MGCKFVDDILQFSQNHSDMQKKTNDFVKNGVFFLVSKLTQSRLKRNAKESTNQENRLQSIRKPLKRFLNDFIYL